MKDFIIKNIDVKEKDIDETTGEFEGFASKFGMPDAVDDVIEKGAFTRTLANKGAQRPLLWQHNPSDPIGKGIHEETNEGLRIIGKCNMGVQKGREGIALLKAKDINGLSIGFNIERKDDADDGKRFIKEINLWETSIATFQCLEPAQVDEVRSLFMGTKKEEKKGIAKIDDALKFFLDYLSKTDEGNINEVKTEIEKIANISMALLLKTGVIVNPYKKSSDPASDDVHLIEGDKKELANAIESMVEMKNKFKEVLNNG